MGWRWGGALKNTVGELEAVERAMNRSAGTALECARREDRNVGADVAGPCSDRRLLTLTVSFRRCWNELKSAIRIELRLKTPIAPLI